MDDVPIDLRHKLNDAPQEQNWGKLVDLMPPETAPDCPDCGERLDVVSVATDAKGDLAAARLLCRPDLQNYIYEADTGELYTD